MDEDLREREPVHGGGGGVDAGSHDREGCVAALAAIELGLSKRLASGHCPPCTMEWKRGRHDLRGRPRRCSMPPSLPPSFYSSPPAPHPFLLVCPLCNLAKVTNTR